MSDHVEMVELLIRWNANAIVKGITSEIDVNTWQINNYENG